MVLAQDLKDAVFQAAIQGNLTERLPIDGNVSDLFSGIVSKKDELLRQKKRSKDSSDKIIPYDENYLDELPSIPIEWRWVKLGELCEKIGAGSTPSGGSKVYVREGIKFLREQNIHNDSLVLDGVAFIDAATNQSLKGSQVYAQDILMNITGASIGRNSLVPDDFDFGNVNQHVLIIRLIDKRMRMYLHQCLLSPFIFNQMMSEQKGDKPGLSATRVSNFMIPLPPIEEQARIVARVDEILGHIDEYSTIEDQLSMLKKEFPSDMKSAILQAALQGKLTEQMKTDSNVDDVYECAKKQREALIKAGEIKNEKLHIISDADKPFDIPSSWRFVRMGEIIKLLSGQDFTPDKYFDYAPPNSIPYLTGASNIEDGDVLINRWTTSGRAIAHLGDLLLTCKGTVGTMAFLNVNEVHIARQIMAISPLGNTNKLYIQRCIENFLLTLKSKAKSAIPGIDRSAVLNLVIPLPPIEEQQRIVERLNVLLPLCDTLME